MFVKLDYKLRLCVCLMLIINFLDQIDCQKTNLLNNDSNIKLNQRTNDAIKNDANLYKQLDKRSLKKKINNNLSPEAKHLNSLNKYFLIYNLLKSKPVKKNVLPSNRFTSRNKFKSRLSLFKRQTSIENQLDNKLNHQNVSTFLSLMNDWKKQQPTCSQLKIFWDLSINKLIDYFLNENNDLFIQPHLNQLDNPIYLALLINLIKDQNENTKILNFKQEPNSLNQLNDKNKLNDKNSDKPNEVFLNRNDLKTNDNPTLNLDYVTRMLINHGKQNHQFDSNFDRSNDAVQTSYNDPYNFKNFHFLDKNSDSKFIPNPIDRVDPSFEIIDEGPTFVYNVDSDSKPSTFWSDAQLSKPLNRPEVHY